MDEDGGKMGLALEVPAMALILFCWILALPFAALIGLVGSVKKVCK